MRAAISFGGYVFPVYSPSVGKPGGRLIFLIVNQTTTKDLMVIQSDYCLLWFQWSNLIFVRLLQCFMLCGYVQNIRFSNSFWRIPCHYKISNVGIEDLVLSLMMDEFEWQLLCSPYCNHIVPHVVIGFWKMLKCLLCGSGPHQTQSDRKVSFPHRNSVLFCYFVIWFIKVIK